MRKLTLAWACLFLAACLSCAIPTLPQKPAIDPALARQYFAEARKLSEADGGRLWGKPLYGPMLFADPGTSFVVASQADAEGRLKEQDGVFVGTLPPEVNVANTATVWAGVKWTMVMWPLPSSPTARARLMMHELFHALQDSLGLPAASPANAHLSMLEGRIWLQLEWRALRQALARPEAPPAERKRAVEDVLLFRLARRALFPKAEAEERGLEMNEGLAEYTGYKLRGTADAATAEVVIARLGSAPDETSFSRSFAYASGPAYGMLLDLAGASWRKGLTPQSDFGELLRQAYGISLPRDLSAAAAERAAIYDGVALRWSETRQAEQRKALADSYRRRLLDGPV
ncbi:MAG TPA: hypothetical protein VEH49_08105, partial [Methylomirabilota bacterium]|nr:hypothetical protein [Methylomirabilota bacterium]